ncbi:MAG: helicase-exonuclease AddAB subunit AddA [Clostridiales bacterium]|nr:helicase-exonuclease AddAB subunit AddA [Clostridiales bacterium]
MPQWTKEQKAAINARNHTILVSAAAGSGKTAVLVERIVGLVREGARLDRMLIVTFTRAAAAEMRQRLNQRIAKEAAGDPERMSQALDDLEASEISTIHAFCQKVIRNDFQAVGVDPLTRICDEQQQQALFEQAFCDAMNELLEDQTEADFLAFADAFEQKEIREMTGRLYTFLMSLPEPFAWLERKINEVTAEPYEHHPWYMTLVEHSARQLQGLQMLMQTQDEMFNEIDAVPALRETWMEDQEAIQRLLTLDAGSPLEMYEALATFSFKKAVVCRGITEEQKEWKKRYTKVRDQMKDLVKTIKDGLRLDPERLSMELKVIQRHLRGLASLVRRTQENFAAYKLQQNVVDFNDLEQMTLQILRQPEYRVKLQQEYDHIFVDECQDVSAVQDAILQSIHGENNCLFMVGDVKQSIYRFRLADPTLFLHRMRTYSNDENARERRIFLQRNFRSRSNVLDATNRVFRKTMQADVTEIDYLPEDELIPGRETENDPSVEIHLLDTTSDEDENIKELEAESQVLARRVKFLLTQSFDENGKTRPYQYRDMVILLPKVARTGPALAELLQQQGVPVYFDGSESYFGLPEIKTMTALLSVLDNPMQDVPLLAALKMTPFSMTDQELADVRLSKTGKDVPFHVAFNEACETENELGLRCREIRERLREWRFRSEIMRIRDFMWYILRESGFYASCGALPEGELRQANLRLLCQRAAEYEDNGGVTLSGFLKQIDSQQQAGDSRSAKTLGESENLVRIMTIHKSKGLEFPVVFCLQMNARMHLSRHTGLKMHSRLGVCLPYVNRGLNIRRETMGDEAFDVQRLLDEKAERARLLYVAMTRARERLILVGCASKEGKISWKMPRGAYRIWSATSMLDWVMQSVQDEQSTGYPQDANPYAIKVWSNFSAQAVEKNKVIHSLSKWLDSVVSVRAVEQLGIDWEGLYQKSANQPLKTSVSSIAKKKVLHDPMPLTDRDEEAEDKRQPEEIISPLRLSELPARPPFMEEKRVTGADRGTMVHHVLSLIDPQALRGNISEGLWQELRRLEELECITPEESNVISHRSLTQFYQSAIGQRMLASGLVRREWSFNLRMEGGTLLQGVIDCAFMEDDGWVLLDYKTDYITDDEAFIQRYAMQLEWYARALEKITATPVKEMWLFALGKGKAYQVERQ